MAATGSAAIGLTAHAERPSLAAPPAVARPVVTIPLADAAAAIVLAEPSTTALTAAPTTRATPKPRPKGDGKNDTNKTDTRAKPPPSGLPLGTPFAGKYVGAEIEGFARYEGQTTCDPTPKPGTVALRDLLLARYPSTNSLGISRGCDVGGQSEHKEGRAFDWGADVGNAADEAAVNDFLTALFATDAQGHKFALARRMGVMYVIWNHQIWGAYSAGEGWRPYDGDNPHTNHVHISLSWAGARGETSFWSGSVVPGLPDWTTTTTSTTSQHRHDHPTTTTWRGPTTTSTTAVVDGSTTSTTTGDTSNDTTTTWPSDYHHHHHH